MISGEPVPSGHRIASGYHGVERVQSQNRGIKECQDFWNSEIKVGSFDDLILAQLENAKKQGRKSVAILDIGSGKGNLFQEFLSDVQAGSKSRAFLERNSDFNIEMLGITDAKSVDELLTEQEIVAKGDSTPDNSQIKAKNIEYTLSSNQGIEDVLKAQKIEGIDLCVSTVALTYLGPNVFENTLKDVIKNLHSGGQMVAYEYAGTTPGIIEPVVGERSLDIRDISDESLRYSSSLKATLSEKATRFGRIVSMPGELNIDDEEKQLERAEDLMVSVGAITADALEKRRKAFLYDPNRETNRVRALDNRALELVNDEKALMEHHILKLRQIKEQQLLALFAFHKGQIEGEFKKSTIRFRKI